MAKRFREATSGRSYGAAAEAPHSLPEDRAGGLKVVYKDPATLKLRARNPRMHSKKQIRQIEDSIDQFGFLNPVLVDGENDIIAGHGRAVAAMRRGMRKIPTVRVDHLTPAQIRAYVVADNKIAENAGWDKELLALELKELSLQLDFDITVTGFETPEIDLLFGAHEAGPDTVDEIPEIDKTIPAVTGPGDLWRFGEHLLLCGDATKPESYARLMGGERAQMIFIDPPYNQRIDGHVCGLGKIKHREFQMAAGEMSEAEFTDFLINIFQNLAAYSVVGALHFVFMDWRGLREVMQAAANVYTELKNLCVWVKTNAGMGSLYRSKHEMVFVFKNGTAPHINNIELGKHGRYRTNVWTYPGVNAFGNDRDAELAMHPTVKPVALVADAILDASRRNGIVLDACAGSGTTLIAAQKTGRRGYGIEIDPYYVDTTIKRFAAVYKMDAVLAEGGETYEEVQQRRAAQREMPNGKSREKPRTRKWRTAKPHRI
jgi:DNA modification methylase